MRREHTVPAIIAAALLAASTSFACAQDKGGSGTARPGPTPGPSSGMPSDLDTTGMAGAQPGCTAPPGGRSSATGSEVRTPSNAGDLRAPKGVDDPNVGTGQTAETSELSPKTSTAGKAIGC